MEMPRNRFKAALKDRRRQIGIWSGIADGLVTEMLAGCGYDWILLDCEHSPIDPIRILPLLQAAAPYDVSPIVRPSSLDVAEIKRLLDLGAQTILVPYVQTVDEATLAVRAVAYPPEGIRGVAGSTRASRFGAVAGYHATARDEICLLIQAETVAALDRLEDLAQVPGVDGVFIGPSDVAASMGYPGQPSHPEVVAACRDAVERLGRIGVPSGFLSTDEAVLAEIRDAGVTFLAVGVDAGLLRGAALARRKAFPS